jgi:nucleoid-associated protein YgaU
MFFRGSRYATVPDAFISDATGRVIRYKTLRFIPETRAPAGHRVVGGERLDHIAYRYYRDPERFWRIADANRALWPDDLLRPGVIIGIPPSEG